MQTCLLDCLKDLLQDSEQHEGKIKFCFDFTFIKILILGFHVQILHAVYCIIIKLLGQDSRMQHQDAIESGEHFFHDSIIPEVE